MDETGASFDSFPKMIWFCTESPKVGCFWAIFTPASAFREPHNSELLKTSEPDAQPDVKDGFRAPKRFERMFLEPV